MKIHISNIAFFLLLVVIVLGTSCEELDVENTYLPDKERVLSDPADLKSLVLGQYHAYFSTIKTYNVGMTAHVAADHTTLSAGNFAWRDMSWEPRRAWNNDPAYSEADVTEVVYNGLSSIISIVNDAIVLINNGMEVGENGSENEMVLASCYLIRGMCIGQLGLTFDKAMVSKTEKAPNGDIESYLVSLDFTPWYEVLEEAIADLQKVVDLTESASFNLPENTVNGMVFTSKYIAQLANSYAARFLTLGARTKAQNTDLSWSTEYSWADVLNFAKDGIKVDFAPVGNGLPWDGGSWYDLNIKYLRQPGWGRVDMRIINMIDPNQPVRYPTNASGYATSEPPNGGRVITNDKRFTQDFEYLPANDFRPERGGWHFSHYRHSRYDDPATTSEEGLFMGESIGPLRELRVWENELMKAEAMVRTGKHNLAIDILNNEENPRKKRGDLPSVSDNEDEILNAIFYERFTELMHNGYLISFCDTRRNDDLQYGTPLHFPVPGKELLTLGREVYTFGGVENADGVNTSNGGDWIKPYYHFTPTW